MSLTLWLACVIDRRIDRYKCMIQKCKANIKEDTKDLNTYIKALSTKEYLKFAVKMGYIPDEKILKEKNEQDN